MKKIFSKAGLRREASRILKAMEEVLMQSASMVAGFEDGEDFKRSLLADLKAHGDFNEATWEFHRIHSRPENASGVKLKKLSAGRKTRTGGRTQASRLEPSNRSRTT